MEEAAAVAAEYIATLDNLPSEVQHLLTEIKHKEARSQELQTEIQRENAKYIRHSLRGGLTARDEALPARVAEIFAEVDRLAAEKLALAQRLVVLVQRARARLDYDLSKVLVLQGDLDPAQQGPFTARTAATQVNDSLRGAMALPDALPVPAPPVVAPLLKRAYPCLGLRVEVC
ncbi:hypothetical protein BV25DRAFT_1817407 [Artomyces pyxidatus]|uniref:Uncharacterized protein n=1 Tax=Artomyces pyxidatus TaxID=48021 RepID=A0ACB8TJD8_9AGAM|nr:hypothetical protein BV25DRAFT_1817407 [Artomyces pyxidatus]